MDHQDRQRGLCREIGYTTYSMQVLHGQQEGLPSYVEQSMHAAADGEALLVAHGCRGLARRGGVGDQLEDGALYPAQHGVRQVGDDGGDERGRAADSSSSSVLSEEEALQDGSQLGSRRQSLLEVDESVDPHPGSLGGDVPGLIREPSQQLVQVGQVLEARHHLREHPAVSTSQRRRR